MAEIKNLQQIIRDNPGCKVEIDNDDWTLYKNDAQPDDYDKWSDDARDEWFENQTLAVSSDEFEDLTGYGERRGYLYGGAVLQALADIVGIQVEPV